MTRNKIDFDITVRDYCLRHTQAQELIAICDPWIRHMVFIDHEDIFVIHSEYADKKVKSEEWETLQIVDSKGTKQNVPCHFIYIN